MDNGPEGCAEFAGKCGSYYSPFMASEADNGVVDCDTMVSDADSADSCLMTLRTSRRATFWYMEIMSMWSFMMARAAITATV